MTELREEQLEEIEALKSIFDADLQEISHNPPCFMIKVAVSEEMGINSPLWLRVTLPPDYPDVVPQVEVPMRSGALSQDSCSRLVAHLRDTAETCVGMPSVYLLVDAAREWIHENVQPNSAEEPSEEVEEGGDDLVISPDSKPLGADTPSSGGRWDYVIGLVGKPSAGKSTFFNAATTLDLARTGAHPFTTIQPNIGQAFYSIPCPCHRLGVACDAAHGHNFHGERHIPVLLKDVAGLVPGASEGRGKGNRFLNDLLDADVLIHILDVSGQTNEKGEETVDYDPCQDVLWLQQELHQWIYGNIMEKWDGIKRKPKKLVDMFTGYHANKHLIHTAFQAAGVGEEELSNLPTWGEGVLKRVVSCFLQTRFPMLVVMNKADVSSAQDNITRLQAKYPDLPCIAVSARAETTLQQLQKARRIAYQFGASHFSIKDVELDSSMQKELTNIQTYLERFGSTNVQAALCKAVELRPPVYAFPVTCLDTFKSKAKPYSGGHQEPETLRDCVSLKPGTTVSELYSTLLHMSLLAGDFVRAETVDEAGKKRPVRKEEVVSSSNCLIKIMTNKRGGAS